jgi:hypothetical protein
MKRKEFLGAVYACLLGFACCVTGTASAATVFAPTDGDVNFLTSSLSSGTILALFDDSDTSYLGGLDVLTGAGAGVPVTGDVVITAGGAGPGDYTATSNSNTLNLTGSDWFLLAISTDGGSTWTGDTGAIYLGSNIYEVHFFDGSVLQIDVQVVPVPAAVWLFGSGLLGLAGIARRRRAG